MYRYLAVISYLVFCVSYSMWICCMKPAIEQPVCFFPFQYLSVCLCPCSSWIMTYNLHWLKGLLRRKYNFFVSPHTLPSSDFWVLFPFNFALALVIYRMLFHTTYVYVYVWNDLKFPTSHSNLSLWLMR